MIGRKSQITSQFAEDAPQGFDDFALRLGDVMRGERATMGKSLLDVQRELRIKASYIAAIENCDPSAFDTPGFIAGYVRSYARYLGMDPDEAFGGFCAESGFSVAHGMSEHASTIRKPDVVRPRTRDPLAEPNMPFAPVGDGFLSRIEPGAVGSTLVLLALIGGIGYGGWSVLQEIQRVQITPVDQTPVVLSELDPLNSARQTSPPDSDISANAAGVFTPPNGEAFDRLYRPQALDVPVLVARDAPISTLDPDSVGVFSNGARADLPQVQDSSLAAVALAEGLAGRGAGAPVAAFGSQGVTLIAARPAWIRVVNEEGRTIRETTLNAGDTYAVPSDVARPRMIVGESGALYFNVNGTTFGPAGPRGTVTQDLSLTAEDLMARYSAAAPGADDDLMAALVEIDVLQRAVTPVAAPVQQVAAVASNTPLPRSPQVLADATPGITVVATAETWVEVTAPSGKKLFAQILQAGDSYLVPQTEQPPTIFSGNAGGVYFAVNGQTFGPYGANGQFGRNLALSAEAIQQKMQVADLSQNQTLAKVVAELNLGLLTPDR